MHTVCCNKIIRFHKHLDKLYNPPQSKTNIQSGCAEASVEPPTLNPANQEVHRGTSVKGHRHSLYKYVCSVGLCDAYSNTCMYCKEHSNGKIPDSSLLTKVTNNLLTSRTVISLPAAVMTHLTTDD